MQKPLTITLTVRPNVTVLPKVLQILSRRGYMIDELKTDYLESGEAVLHCAVTGPDHWHGALPALLERLVDVVNVRMEEPRNV